MSVHEGVPWSLMLMWLLRVLDLEQIRSLSQEQWWCLLDPESSIAWRTIGSISGNTCASGEPGERPGASEHREEYRREWLSRKRKAVPEETP